MIFNQVLLQLMARTLSLITWLGLEDNLDLLTKIKFCLKEHFNRM